MVSKNIFLNFDWASKPENEIPESIIRREIIFISLIKSDMFLELDNLINCLSLKLESINNLFLTKKFDEIYQQVILE